MQQTESFNGGAHGNIHGLLGGTWSAEADEYAAKTPDIVLPFVHHVYVRVSCGRGKHVLEFL